MCTYLHSCIMYDCSCYNSSDSHINNTRRTVQHEPLLKVCIETFKTWINALSIKKNMLLIIPFEIWGDWHWQRDKVFAMLHENVPRKSTSVKASVLHVSRCTVITIWNLPHSLVFSTRCTWKSPAVGRSAPSGRHFPVDNNTDKWGQRTSGTRTCGHTHTQRVILSFLWIKRQSLWHAYLSGNLTIKSKSSSQSSFTDGLRTVDFITQHQHWYIDYGLVS